MQHPFILHYIKLIHTMLHRPVVVAQSDKMTCFYLAELQILLIIVTKDDMLYCDPCLEEEKCMDFEVS